MSKSALTIQGERAWSYTTCLRDLTPEGRVVLNQTKYSTTSQRHLSQVLRQLAVPADALFVDQVPRGTYSLAALVDQTAARREEQAFLYDPEDL